MTAAACLFSLAATLVGAAALLRAARRAEEAASRLRTVPVRHPDVDGLRRSTEQLGGSLDDRLRR